MDRNRPTACVLLDISRTPRGLLRDVGRALARHSAQEAFQLPAPHGVLQLANGLGFDLADALAGDLEDAADLFQRVGVAVAQAVAQA